jgi:hypothetical protein
MPVDAERRVQVGVAERDSSSPLRKPGARIATALLKTGDLLRGGRSPLVPHVMQLEPAKSERRGPPARVAHGCPRSTLGSGQAYRSFAGDPVTRLAIPPGGDTTPRPTHLPPRAS